MCSLLAISGCGLRPLYAPVDGQDIGLDQVKIEIIDDRPGQILRNYLINSMTPKGLQGSPKYVMSITLEETIRQIGFRRDKTARHSELNLSATVILKDADSDKVLLKERIFSKGAYAISGQAEFGSYTSKVAEETTRTQILKVISDDIKLRVAGYLQGIKNEN